MKLLKLVPENTNLDFMRWRNVALVLSILATAASIAFTVYRGLNLGIDFVGGQVQLMFGPLVAIMPLAEAGKIRALAVTSSKRSALAPGVPTMSQSGIVGF